MIIRPYNNPDPYPATVLSGPGLHTGAPATVRITLRADDGLGPRLSFPGFSRPLALDDLRGLTYDARRATVLADPSTGAIIHTPEHLLAALWMFMDAPVDITCDLPEIPGLDGSARPWFTALAVAIPPEFAAPPREEDAQGWDYAGPEGQLRAEPAESFSVAYTVERGAFHESFTLESASAAPANILPARTFIFWKDWSALTGASTEPITPGGTVATAPQQGQLLAGAGQASGLLLAESPEEFDRVRSLLPESSGNTFPLLHPQSFRFDHETARHKILDLLGDLALRGRALPRLRITVRNGGHALHHLLLNHLEATAP